MYLPPKHPYSQPDIRYLDILMVGAVRPAQLTADWLFIWGAYDAAVEDVKDFLRQSSGHPDLELLLAYELPADFEPTPAMMAQVRQIRLLEAANEACLLALEDEAGQQVAQLSVGVEVRTAYTHSLVKPKAVAGRELNGFPVLASLAVQNWWNWVGQLWETDPWYENGKFYLKLASGGNWSAQTFLLDSFGVYREDVLEMTIVEGDLPQDFDPHKDSYVVFLLDEQGEMQNQQHAVLSEQQLHAKAPVHIGIMDEADYQKGMIRLKVATQANLLITEEWPE